MRTIRKYYKKKNKMNRKNDLAKQIFSNVRLHQKQTLTMVLFKLCTVTEMDFNKRENRENLLSIQNSGVF